MTETVTECLWDRRYLLRREIARGGMCVVHAAEHAFTGRLVAIKMPSSDHYDRESILRRVQREARALELCRHPNVVEILDAGITPGESTYIVMEMLEGRTLEGLLAARHTLSIEETVSIGRQLCDALHHLSRHGIVHRDIKANNLIISRDTAGIETLKLIDFGIARIDRDPAGSQAQRITKMDEILGTPEYMAPEQMMMRPVDHRADIYGAAATLFECLTGTVPYPGQFGDILMRIHTEPVPSIRAMRPEVPAALAAVVERGLAREPEERFPDAFSFGLALVRASGCGLQPTALLGAPPAAPVNVASAYRLDASPSTTAVSQQRRRKFDRLPYVTPIRMAHGELVTYGRTEDISEGGLLALAVRPFPIGETIEVNFASPVTGTPQRLAAVVRWVRESSKAKQAIGLEFEWVDETLRAEIDAYARICRAPGLQGEVSRSDTSA